MRVRNVGRTHATELKAPRTKIPLRGPTHAPTPNACINTSVQIIDGRWRG
jgi:hypothetical protein